jgi:hypothetical protein
MTVRLVDLPPTPPKIVTPLWTLTKDTQRVEAQLVDQSAAGCELRMMQNGAWLSGRRFRDVASAMAHGEHVRRELERKRRQDRLPVPSQPHRSSSAER